MQESNSLFVSVIIPLALPIEYTYSVPTKWHNNIQIGSRVEIPLKRKLYSGIVCKLGSEIDSDKKPKEIICVLDDNPILSQKQLDLWKWIAKYYCCTLGEVMHAALPSGFKLESATKVLINDSFEHDYTSLSDEEYLVAEALTLREELSIQEIRDILDKKTIYPVIRSLIDQGVIQLKEELIKKFKPKTIRIVRLSEQYKNEQNLSDFLDNTKSEKQKRAVLAYMTLKQNGEEKIPVSDIYSMSNSDSSVIRALEKKEIFISEKVEVSRLKIYDGNIYEVPDLSNEQNLALEAIRKCKEERKPVLLHGITGSGKTRIYIELINEMLEQNKQSLYLLPEIALTTQIVERLEHYFGDDIVIYHSRLSNDQRVEIWNAIKNGKKIVLGARSSLFLPFQDLGLVIVDEEHDPSYKQNNPNPRYNARDTSIVLANQNKAFVVLGSATPSLESYTNAINNKYGLITLNKRYGNSVLPEIKIVDLKREKQVGRLKNRAISKPLEDALTHYIAENKQAILFQNRRGFAPVVQCNECGWIAECKHCDVSLTVHRYFDELRCHYCGHRDHNPRKCPDCGSDNLFEMGQGTERIQEELIDLYPNAQIGRMDYDTTRSKKNFDKIIYDFSTQKLDILVGTQMITKGFDFDHLRLVGVINADSLIKFPDFRAGERAFQIITQVAGRAGRRGEKGLVYIQTFDTTHPLIAEIVNTNYEMFYQREMYERKTFKFPPFVRLINLELKSKDLNRVQEGSTYFAKELAKKLGNHRVKGPITPTISRIKNNYIQLINIKLENDKNLLHFTKNYILHVRSLMKNKMGIKNVRVNIDVDPY